MEHQ
jgi:hypothetical protein